MELYHEIFTTPLGEVCIFATEVEIVEVNLFQSEWEQKLEKLTDIKQGNAVTKEAKLQLQEYFEGKRLTFNLPLQLIDTDYRLKVWKALGNIPYGQVVSYQDIANEIGNPKSVRAIGQANKANRIPIIIPCHRVIGKSGKMVGYAGDRVNIKEYLLEHEKNILLTVM